MNTVQTLLVGIWSLQQHPKVLFRTEWLVRIREKCVEFENRCAVQLWMCDWTRVTWEVGEWQKRKVCRGVYVQIVAKILVELIVDWSIATNCRVWNSSNSIIITVVRSSDSEGSSSQRTLKATIKMEILQWKKQEKPFLGVGGNGNEAYDNAAEALRSLYSLWWRHGPAVLPVACLPVGYTYPHLW